MTLNPVIETAEEEEEEASGSEKEEEEEEVTPPAPVPTKPGLVASAVEIAPATTRSRRAPKK